MPPRTLQIKKPLHQVVCFLVLILLTAGCTPAAKYKIFPPEARNKIQPVYLINHGLHTGLAMKRSAIPEGLIPEKWIFSEMEYLEFGWGDKTFYISPKNTSGMAVRALLWPTESVVHAAGFNGPVEYFFITAGIVRIDLSPEGFTNMCLFIHDTFERDGKVTADILTTGQYGNSYFFSARGSYYFPKTSNVWTARALRKAGCPIQPLTSLSAGTTIERAASFGTVIQTFQN